MDLNQILQALQQAPEGLMQMLQSGFQQAGQSAQGMTDMAQQRMQDVRMGRQPQQDDLQNLISGILSFGPGATRQVGSKTFSSGPQAFAQLAKEGVQPLSAPHEMLPGLMDTVTGQISHSMKPGPYQHQSLYAAVPKSWKPQEVWVDPKTWNAFTSKMLSSFGGGM